MLLMLMMARTLDAMTSCFHSRHPSWNSLVKASKILAALLVTKLFATRQVSKHLKTIMCHSRVWPGSKTKAQNSLSTRLSSLGSTLFRLLREQGWKWKMMRDQETNLEIIFRSGEFDFSSKNCRINGFKYFTNVTSGSSSCLWAWKRGFGCNLWPRKTLFLPYLCGVCVFNYLRTF